jgi:hypothetical protein
MRSHVKQFSAMRRSKGLEGKIDRRLGFRELL